MEPDRLDAIHAWLQQADEELLYTPQEETLADRDQAFRGLVDTLIEELVDRYIQRKNAQIEAALTRLVDEGHYRLDDLAVVSFVPQTTPFPEFYICRAADLATS